MVRGVRPSAVLVCMSILLLSAVLPGGTALPTVQPPATTVDVGSVGIVDEVPYAATMDGILVSPGSKVTIKADYLFRDSAGTNGYTSYNHANLQVIGNGGPIGSDVVSMQFSGPNSFSWNGTLAFVLAVPENVRSLSVVLEARLFHGAPMENNLEGVAQSSSPLIIVAVPQPVTFATDDLVVADAFEVGVIDWGGAQDEITAVDGKSFVSTDAGTRFTAEVKVERPALSGMTHIVHHGEASIVVQVEGGATYWSGLMLFGDQCFDWSTGSCALAAETRTGQLDLLVPPGAIGPRSVVHVQLHVWHHLEYMDMNGFGAWEMENDSDGGRHVVYSL